MNGATWTINAPANTSGRCSLFATAVILSGSATVAATIVGNGNVSVALAPILAVLALTAIWWMPVRLTLFALTFFALALDTPGDVAGLWHSPVAWLGQLLTINLNKTVPISALAFPLVAALLLYVLLIVVHRWMSTSRLDDRDGVMLTAPMFGALAISALTVVGLCVEGVVGGGDIQMAKIQVQTFLQVLLLGFLLGTSLRGTRDYWVLGRLIVAAACSKALMALWVWLTIAQSLAFRTRHGDSMLFACAAVILLALVFEQPSRRNMKLCLLILPLILAGMLANNRRIVWVEVLAALIILAAISPRTRLKVRLSRVMLMALPFITIYGIVGWNSEARIFGPVHTLRSVGDADIDGSTLYRDIENYNLLATIREDSFTGIGFGQPYRVVVTNADLSFFSEWLFLPHNSILGLWGVGGLVGFTGLGTAVVVGVFFLARRYFESASPVERVAAFASIASVSIYLIHCWGDIGFSEKETIFLVGPALAVAGQRTQAGISRRSGLAAGERAS